MTKYEFRGYGAGIAAALNGGPARGAAPAAERQARETEAATAKPANSIDKIHYGRDSRDSQEMKSESLQFHVGVFLLFGN